MKREDGGRVKKKRKGGGGRCLGLEESALVFQMNEEN